MTNDMRWPENIKLKVKQKVLKEISRFYENVGLKYNNIYGREEIRKLILENLKKPNQINHSKFLTDPVLEKWKGYGRVLIGKWNFAIDIKDNKVIIVDACHQQNMTNDRSLTELFEEDLNIRIPRITNITIPPARDNRHFIHCKIDGERQPMKVINPDIYRLYEKEEMTLYQLAERCYAKELKEDRFELDVFLNKGRKI